MCTVSVYDLTYIHLHITPADKSLYVADPSIPNHHLQNLHHLLLLPQRDRIGLTPPIIQTPLRQRRQFLPSHTHLLQRPRHAQFPENRIQHIPQITPPASKAPPAQNLLHRPFPPQHPQHLPLLRPVHRLVEPDDRGQKHAARLPVPHPQRAQLVPDPVTRPHRHAQQAATDRVPRAEQTPHPRPQRPRVRLGRQQPRHQGPQPRGRVRVPLGRRGEAAHGLDAVVDGAHARAQPHAHRRRGAEFRAQDHEARGDGEVLEGVLVHGVVVGGAGDGGVFARGEGGGDADDRDGRREERVPEGGGVEVEGREGGEGGGGVGEGEGDDFGGVGQAAAAEGDEDVRFCVRGFVHDAEDVGVVAVGPDALSDTYDGTGADCGFEGVDEGG